MGLAGSVHVVRRRHADASSRCSWSGVSCFVGIGRSCALPAQDAQGAPRRRRWRPRRARSRRSTLDGAGPLIARQVFDTLVAYREGTTRRRSGARHSLDGVARWSHLDVHACATACGSTTAAPLTAAEVAAELRAPALPARRAARRCWPTSAPRYARASSRRCALPMRRRCRSYCVQPYAPLLTVLAHPALGDRADDRPPPTARPDSIGTGPYRIVETPRPVGWRSRRCPATGERRPGPSGIVFLEVGRRRERRGGVRRPGARHLVSRRRRPAG